MKRIWPHVRAGFVLFHLVAVFVLAFPAPIGGMDRSNWKMKTVQQDFEAWAQILHVSAAAFEDALWEVSVVFMAGRDRVAAPFGPYVRWSGCDQPWRMFVAPVRNMAKLQVQLLPHGAPGEQWETLFEERSPQYRWHAEMFETERLRTQLSRWPWPAFNSAYGEGCAHLARLAFKERPDAEQVRCRFWSAQSLTPDEARAGVQPQGFWSDPIVHHRPSP